jgi:hypothetical protein
MTPTVYHQLKSDQRIQEINPHIGYTFWLAPNARSAQLHIEKTFGSLTNAGILLAELAGKLQARKTASRSSSFAMVFVCWRSPLMNSRVWMARMPRAVEPKMSHS